MTNKSNCDTRNIFLSRHNSCMLQHTIELYPHLWQTTYCKKGFSGFFPVLKILLFYVITSKILVDTLHERWKEMKGRGGCNHKKRFCPKSPCHLRTPVTLIHVAMRFVFPEIRKSSALINRLRNRRGYQSWMVHISISVYFTVWYC